jgi:hypothetical protein
MKTHGEITFDAGFNLKNEIVKLLNNNNILFTKVRHYVVSPYEKQRYKPEYAGQEVWVKLQNYTKSVVLTQTDYETFKDANQLDNLIERFL